jgi:hypothetical protein
MNNSEIPVGDEQEPVVVCHNCKPCGSRWFCTDSREPAGMLGSQCDDPNVHCFVNPADIDDALEELIHGPDATEEEYIAVIVTLKPETENVGEILEMLNEIGAEMCNKIEEKKDPRIAKVEFGELF